VSGHHLIPVIESAAGRRVRLSRVFGRAGARTVNQANRRYSVITSPSWRRAWVVVHVDGREIPHRGQVGF
jgi:hypothetical protein